MARHRSRVTQGPKFEKLDHDLIRSLRTESNLPKLDYSWRRGGDVKDIPSLVTTTSSPSAYSTSSVMSPQNLDKESPEVRDAIIAKSKRLAPAYNKGAVQYVSDETDPKTIGRK